MYKGLEFYRSPYPLIQVYGGRVYVCYFLIFLTSDHIESTTEEIGDLSITQMTPTFPSICLKKLQMCDRILENGPLSAQYDFSVQAFLVYLT